MNDVKQEKWALMTGSDGMSLRGVRAASDEDRAQYGDCAHYAVGDAVKVPQRRDDIPTPALDAVLTPRPYDVVFPFTGAGGWVITQTERDAILAEAALLREAKERDAEEYRRRLDALDDAEGWHKGECTECGRKTMIRSTGYCGECY